jgi:putative membrane protein
MKQKIVLGIKGFLIGIASILPGISGGTLSLALGIYEDLIKAVNHFFEDMKKHFMYLLPIIIGAGLSVALLSNVIDFVYTRYELATTLLFVGLMLGGLPYIYKEVENSNKSYYIYGVIALIIVISMGFLKETDYAVSFNNIDLIGYLKLFGVGIIAAATMVIPGISGSLILMLLGYYQPIVSIIKDLTRFNNIFTNILILIPFGIGVLIGIILIAKLIEFLFNKFKEQTYYGILGFVIGSTLLLLFELNFTENITELIIGIILFVIGTFTAYKLGEL